MRPSIAAALLALLLGAPAEAQYAAYSTPGSLAEIQEQEREEILQEIVGSRWRFGPLYLDPRLSFGNLSYVGNVYSSADDEAVSDLRGQAAAGLRAYLHLAPKMVLAGFAAADYSWWQREEELRTLNESFGAQLFGLFNRLQVQLDAGRIETQRSLSNEVEAPVNARTDRLEVSFDIDLYGPLVIFGAARRQDNRFFGEAAERALPALDLRTLDGTTETLSAGLRYEPGQRLSVGLGAERIESEFDRDPDGRSNESSGLLLQLRFEGNRLSLALDVAARDIDFANPLRTADRRQTTGQGQLGWRFGERLRASLYGSTQLDYSALDSASLFESRRSGASLQLTVSPRLALGAFYEVGDDEFSTVVADDVLRLDDLRSYGVTAEFKPAQRLSIKIRAFDSQRDSTDPQFTRSRQTVLSEISLGGDLLPW